MHVKIAWWQFWLLCSTIMFASSREGSLIGGFFYLFLVCSSALIEWYGNRP
jgi:hypothetical protein